MELIAPSSNRLDKILSNLLNKPRNQVEQLIKKGFVKIGDRVVTKTGTKVLEGETIFIELPAVEKSESKEVNFDVERIYEDEDILVINKPAGIVVHPAPSVKDATLVDWLKNEGVRLSTLSGEERHGIVHRLDKETSGLMVVAKNNEAHSSLARQLQDRSMGRYYLALIDPPLKEDVMIERPIARNPKNRLKMAIVDGGRHAKTFFKKILLSNDEKKELIGAKLFTGRTHQIRVHLASINRHILGDTLYGFKSQKDTIPRVFLHAYILYLVHPSKGEKMHFVASVPGDMLSYMRKHFDMETIDEKIDPHTLLGYFDHI